MTTSRDGTPTEAHEAHWIEWTTGILSAAAVAGLIGWIGWQALTASPEAPSFRVETIQTSKVEGGWRVLFSVTNLANATASSVVVHGTSGDGDKPEEAEATLDYIAGQSEETGGLFFTQDPAKSPLKLRVTGYAEP